MIRIRGLTKDYDRRQILRGIDLSVDPGEMLFLTGPSGAGKTTLLRLLYAAERPTSGEIWVAGSRVDTLPRSQLPPLRRRKEDIPLLAEAFFKRLRLKSGRDIDGIGEATMDALLHYQWPGNVRELKSAFEYAFVTCHEPYIQPYHLPASIYSGSRPSTRRTRRSAMDMKAIERRELVDALEKTGGNQSQAARLLGVSRVTVWNRMKRYGIRAKRQVSTA